MYIDSQYAYYPRRLTFMKYHFVSIPLAQSEVQIPSLLVREQDSEALNLDSDLAVSQ